MKPARIIPLIVSLFLVVPLLFAAEDIESLMQKAMAAYKNKDYKTAISLIREINGRLTELDNPQKITNTIKVDAFQLYKEYTENAMKADKKYAGKLLEISGDVFKIDYVQPVFMQVPNYPANDFENGIPEIKYPAVMMKKDKNDNIGLFIICLFKKEDADILSDIETGKHLITGYIAGIAGNRLYVIDCKVIR